MELSTPKDHTLHNNSTRFYFSPPSNAPISLNFFYVITFLYFSDQNTVNLIFIPDDWLSAMKILMTAHEHPPMYAVPSIYDLS